MTKREFFEDVLKMSPGEIGAAVPFNPNGETEVTEEWLIAFIRNLLEKRNPWHYVDEEMPELGTTVLVVAETDSPFGKVLGSYLDNYEERTGWGRTIKVWNRADRNGDKVLAWLPIPKFERKEKEDGR